MAAGALVALGTRGLVAVAAAALRATDPFWTGTVKQPAEASRSTTPRRDVSCCQYVRLENGDTVARGVGESRGQVRGRRVSLGRLCQALPYVRRAQDS